MVFSDVDQVAELIHRIQNYVSPRRIRMKEFYLNFDKLNSGRCTKAQFGRAIDTAGFRIADSEVDALVEHFTEIGPNVQKPQIVNYAKFCDAIEEVFKVDVSIGSTTDDGFGSPYGSPNKSMGMSMSMTSTSFMPKPVADEERMNHVMHRLAAMCKARGVCFKFVFHDFDRGPSPSPSMINPRRGGKVTVSQFRRMFPFKKEFSEEDLECIMERYKTDGGDIHFQAIHNDISEVLSAEPPPFPQSGLILKPDPTQWDHQTLNPIKKIQSKVVEKRVRLGEYFADFDPLRKGFCTSGQLKTVLSILRLESELDRNDFNHLIEAYSRDDGMFCHALFCRDIDAAFAVPGLEKEPLAVTVLPDPSHTAPGRRNRQVLTSNRKKEIDHLENKLRSRIAQRRILMKPMFLDMDKAHKGVVTRNQFQRVMGQLGFEVLTSEVTLLCSMYCDRGNHNDFNYVDFIKACDPPIEEEELAMQQLNAPYQDCSPSKYFDGMRVNPLDRAASPIMF